jgi:SagB-type dehydrogenase family enzyme
MTEGIGKEFMEKTQYEYLGESDQRKGLPQPPLELDYDKTKSLIDLPSPKKLNFKDFRLRDAIENRRSIRQYSDQPLSLKELSWLLWCTQGVKEVKSTPVTLRNVPSAGARHAFETYLLVNNVEGLKSGLYRFLAIDHKIIELSLETDLADKLTEACLNQIAVKKSAVTFFWIAVEYRMRWRYQERGYRYLNLDAGHVCQNLYLAGESIGCGSCAIAAYDDKAVNNIFNLDGKEKFVIYLATVGKK